jgi:HSP20 family molecular chaperone IbpA
MGVRSPTARMRYRHLHVRYAWLAPSGPTWPFGEGTLSDRWRILVQGAWRPDADLYETSRTVEIAVDLAGAHEDDLDIQLFEDVIVVAGHRRLPPPTSGALYHAAAIRQGAFQLVLPLPAAIDPDRVETHYERGILRVILPKRAETL